MSLIKCGTAEYRYRCRMELVRVRVLVKVRDYGWDHG